MKLFSENTVIIILHTISNPSLGKAKKSIKNLTNEYPKNLRYNYMGKLNEKIEYKIKVDELGL